MNGHLREKEKAKTMKWMLSGAILCVIDVAGEDTLRGNARRRKEEEKALEKNGGFGGKGRKGDGKNSGFGGKGWKGDGKIGSFGGNGMKGKGGWQGQQFGKGQAAPQ